MNDLHKSIMICVGDEIFCLSDLKHLLIGSDMNKSKRLRQAVNQLKAQGVLKIVRKERSGVSAMWQVKKPFSDSYLKGLRFAKSCQYPSLNSHPDTYQGFIDYFRLIKPVSAVN